MSALYDHIPLVVATHPQEDWVNADSPHWHHTWRSLVFLGATIWRAILKDKDCNTQWFPFSRTDTYWNCQGSMRADQLVQVVGLLEAILHQRDKTGKALRQFVGTRAEELIIPKYGYMDLWELDATDWQNVAEKVVPLVVHQKLANQTGGQRKAYNELMWIALSLFPPLTIPEDQTNIIIQVRTKDRWPPVFANLNLVWKDRGRVAWEIFTNQLGGARWSGNIHHFFSWTNAKLVLLGFPGPEYISSFYRVAVENRQAHFRGFMGWWVVVATHVPTSDSPNATSVVDSLYKMLSLPHVRERVQQEIENICGHRKVFSCAMSDGDVRMYETIRLTDR